MTDATAARVEARGLVATAWLTGTAFMALLMLYLVGLDQGATSIFGSDTHIHEFVHDARHLLGFPCH
ncbi:cobalt transporter [Mycobacterium sp. E136]|uniref:CbtB domain-containing protein n=1 Tax=Mycobacterium sp. E136 TaxID=1834125 RepID=UPI0007FE6DFD|nr:CbtB-domain containing protein [Mycobacterium sp. E136]OBG85762.1 cobalt transporter [Mycobacterium sp. E136]